MRSEKDIFHGFQTMSGLDRSSDRFFYGKITGSDAGGIWFEDIEHENRSTFLPYNNIHICFEMSDAHVYSIKSKVIKFQKEMEIARSYENMNKGAQ